MDEIEQASPDEQRRHAATLKHTLAMQALGIIRTTLNVHRGTFQTLLDAEQNIALDSNFRQTMHNASFNLQVRMVRSAMRFMDEMNELADEALSMMEKEKTNGR